MAKPNYAFAKRQRDLAKKQKKEEKKLRKASGTPEGGENTAGDQGADPAETVSEQDAGQGAEQGEDLAQNKVTDQA